MGEYTEVVVHEGDTRGVCGQDEAEVLGKIQKQQLRGPIIGKKDKLRELIDLAREAYELSASPPALDYSRHIDITFRDDLTRRSRSFLLRFSIDIKYAIQKTLDALPEARAEALNNWINDGSNYAEYQLSYKKRFFLKNDRLRLKQAIRGNKWP